MSMCVSVVRVRVCTFIICIRTLCTLGTPHDDYVSMGVISDGNSYGIPEDLIFSFPCRCRNGKWSIVQNLNLTTHAKNMLKRTSAQLLEEKEVAHNIAFPQSKL